MDDPPPPSTSPGRCESEFARLYQIRHFSSIGRLGGENRSPLPVSMVETPADGVRSVSRPSCDPATAEIVPNDGHLARKQMKSCQTSVVQPSDGQNRAKRPSLNPPPAVCEPNDSRAVHRTPSAAEKTVVQRIERRRRVEKGTRNEVLTAITFQSRLAGHPGSFPDRIGTEKRIYMPTTARYKPRINLSPPIE